MAVRESASAKCVCQCVPGRKGKRRRTGTHWGRRENCIQFRYRRSVQERSGSSCWRWKSS
jgi:hypothetical protein